MFIYSPFIYLYIHIVGDGQGNLVCCSPWDCKESDMTEQLKITDVHPFHLYLMYGTVLNSLL